MAEGASEAFNGNVKALKGHWEALEIDGEVLKVTKMR